MKMEEPSVESNAMKQKIAEEYLSSLADLNVNSKPLINMLTILAEENMDHAEVIVKVVDQHISKVDAEIKLPVLYLIDSIVKNVGGQYIQLFSQCIVNIFVGVFDKVKENVREKMYALRQTWVEVFPPQKLYTLDVKVKCIDQNWPITAKVPTPAIHVNPKFLTTETNDPSEMQAKLLAKQQELLELQNRKLEMELKATKLRLKHQEQRLQLERTATGPAIPPPPGVNANEINTDTTAILPNPQVNVHVNKNYQFNQARTNMRKGPNINNAQSNFSTSANPVGNRPRIAPVNSAMLSTLSRRDPRLARQQQPQQHLHQKQDQTLHNNSKSTESLTPHPKLEISKTFEEQKIRNEEDIITSFGKKRAEDRILEEHSGNKGSRLKNSTSSPSKDRRSPIIRDFKNSSKTNEKSKSSSNRNDRTDRPRDKDRHRDKDKKHSDKKFKDSDNEKTKTKEEKYSKDNTSGILQIGEAPMPPKLIELPFHNRKRSPTRNNHKSSPPKDIKSKEKIRNKSPSPNIEKTKLDKEIADKRIKLTATFPTTIASNCLTTTTTLSSTLPTISAETTTIPSTNISNKDKMSKISKLEQNKDEELTIPPQNMSKDVDLRKISKMDIDINAIDEIDIIDKFKKSDEIVSNDNIDKAIEIRPNITKKRTSSDEFILGEPTNKKSKIEEIDSKIDILFGTEDVDLRKLPTDEVSPPPPPMISTENESWAKVKGVKPGITEKLSGKSSLDDVRAKLAKAAKNNNYSFGKGVKKTIKKPIVEEFNEDSQDGAADSNLRTIISQAQELLESKGISSEQYNTLVKTAMQINETNKLKEAQRRESLTLQHDKENKNDDPKLIFTNMSPKEQRKKLPKIPKTSESKQNNSEFKQLETKKSELSHEFNDVSVKRSHSPMEKLDENDRDIQNNTTTRRRRKESKWSSMTPWEIQQQKQQNWMLQQQQQQQPSSVPPPPFPPKLLAIPPVPGAPLQGPHNQWQNPPSIIFGGNAIQPIAAASIANLNNAPLMNSGNSGNMSGPAFSNSVNNPQDDIVRTIPIDGVSKEIRIYDDVAIVFMDWDQPREIGFQNGQRRIIIDNQEPIALNFNEDFVNITISGSIHRIKYGFPSRELYIDANWYECYFGGPPLTIPLDGSFHILQIEGPPPQVNIGPIRQDLVVGKINLVIDAHVVIPVFLDSRPQSFELYNKKHVIQFTDSLSTALIDNEPMEVEYGGLPKSFNMNGEKHFIRFTTLPSGIIPGRVNIKNMICTKPKESLLVEDLKQENDIKSVPIPALIPSLTSIVPPSIALNVPPATIEDVSKAAEVPIVTNLLNNISSIEPTNGIASLPGSNQSTTTIPTATPSSLPSVSSVLPPSLNIDELFQKLIASGILNNQPKVEEKKKEEEQEQEEIKITFVDLKKSESIKTRQSAIVNTLFSGMQCSSCGLRFPPEQTMKYSQHLDWHFRQNRRERDSNRKAHSRKWYYDLSDWLQYEEIEDLEDREKNWFETQQVELETDENSNQKCASPQPSCSAEAEDVDRGCEICMEKFEHFYNEELEEWHLKSAIKVDNSFYHPICYKDLQDAIVKEAKENEEAKTKEKEEVKEEETECIEIDDSVIVIKQEKSDGTDKGQVEDEDDDVIVLPNEEPSITEIPDDDDYEIFSPVINETAEQDGGETREQDGEVSNEEKSSQIEKSPTNDDTVIIPSEQKDSNEKTAANVSLEDDIVIEEPKIPFQDLDNYVEKDLSHLNEDSTQSSFTNIKIKEEPKDDDEDELIEDDVFEDVGTVEGTVEINDSLDSPLPTCVVEVEEETDADKDLNAVLLDNDASSSVNVSIDGNIRINNVPSQKLGVNKIKINIAKNIVNSSNNSNLNNNNNSSNINSNENNIDSSDTNKVDKIENQQIQQQISTIPVITTNQNFNRREFSVYNNSNSTTVSQNSTTTTVTTTTSVTISSNNNSNKINNTSSSQTISLNKPNSSTNISSLLSNSTTLISIPTMNIESPVSSKQTEDEEDKNSKEPPKIEFTFKPELQNIEFKTVEKLEKGFETSGLCSIM